MTDLTPPPLGPEHALFLDFDGTLVGFASTPNGVKVSPELVGNLEKVSERLGGALAIVTGREIVNIGEQLAPLELPVAGSHGAERKRSDGQIETPDETVAQVAGEIADALKAELGDIDKMIIERKVFSVAVHYRQVPEWGEKAVETALGIVANSDGFEAVLGNMVIEIRPKNLSKGSAVEAFMAEEPFAGRIPVFVGDDTTDEDGIRVAMGMGGFGIKVGTATSLARYRLGGPENVHAWLDAFVR